MRVSEAGLSFSVIRFQIFDASFPNGDVSGDMYMYIRYVYIYEILYDLVWLLGKIFRWWVQPVSVGKQIKRLACWPSA